MARYGKGAVKLFEDQGMPPAHIEAFSHVAKQRQEVIIVRPVSIICRRLLEEGYPTKGFHIKGKSSNWGPQAAFICREQKFSKKYGNDADIKKYNAQVESCISEGYAEPVQLMLSLERLMELVERKLIINFSFIHPGNNHVRFDAFPPNHSTKFHFFGAKTKEGLHAMWVFNTKTGNSDPLIVLAAPGGYGPMTADYDLLAVCPRYKHLSLGTYDRMQVINVSHKVLERRLEAYEARHRKLGITEPKSRTSIAYLREQAKPALFYRKEDLDFGNITPRIMACVRALNARLGRGAGKDAVHHSADTGNPVTDLEANYPATAFHPENLDTYKDAAVLENHVEFRSYVKFLLDSGFYLPRNPLWDDLKRIRSTSFRDRQAMLENLLRGHPNR